MNKAKTFDTTPCKGCGHPKGIHNPKCWAYGLVEPKCRKHCTKFKGQREKLRK